MTLLDHEELEERLAVTRLAQEVSPSVADLLESLERRLSALTGEGDRVGNPFGPLSLGWALREALDGWSAGIEARVVLYRGFGRLLSERLPEIYESMENLLAGRGIGQASAGSRVARARGDVGDEKEKRVEEAGAASMGEETDRDSADIGDRRTISGMEVSPEALARAWDVLRGDRPESLIPMPSADGLPVMPRSSVREALAEAQRRWAELDEMSGASLADRQAGMRAVMLEALGQADPDRARERLGEEDHRTLDLILAMFNEVLDDPLLPDAMRAEIARLQIPVLKAAMQDTSFLGDNGHPARRLIDALARTGIGLDESSDAVAGEVYRTVRRLVDEIVQDPEGGVDVFSRALEDLESGTARLELRRRRMERHAAERAAGEDRQAGAEDAVLSELRKLGLDVLPEEIHDFVVGPWRRLLVLLWLREGWEGSNFRQGVGTVRDLTYLLGGDLYRDRPDLFLRRMDRVLDRIGRGLRYLCWPKRKTDRILGVLRAYRNEARKLLPNVWRVGAEGGPVDGVAQFTRMEQDEHDRMVAALEEGQWVRFQAEDSSGKPMVCKLAWYSRHTSTYLFVNGVGRETLKIRAPDLAARFRAGRAEIVEDVETPWVTRVLNRLVGRYRRGAATKAKAEDQARPVAAACASGSS